MVSSVKGTKNATESGHQIRIVPGEGTMDAPSTIIRHPVVDPAAWRGEELAGSDHWRFPLSEAARSEIEAAVTAARRLDRKLLEIRREDFPLPELAGFLAARRRDLEEGLGFFVLKGLPVDRLSSDDATLMFWGIGQHLGDPEGQDRAGNLLHDVRDTGQRVNTTDNVRSYQTNDELRFHNDGAGAFLLLCLRPAQSGGTSKLVSAVAVFNEIVRTRPDLAEVLQRPFHFDARGQHPEGLKVQSVPIFAFHGGRLSVLYKRNYIELAATSRCSTPAIRMSITTIRR
jgi:hypothetical protein